MVVFAIQVKVLIADLNLSDLIRLVVRSDIVALVREGKGENATEPATDVTIVLSITTKVVTICDIKEMVEVLGSASVVNYPSIVKPRTSNDPKLERVRANFYCPTIDIVTAVIVLTMRATLETTIRSSLGFMKQLVTVCETSALTFADLSNRR